MTTNNEPQLDPPGAGLPALELFVARILFSLKRRFGSRESFNEKFLFERALIKQLIQSCDQTSLARPVLIERARGMEDSSRNWSVLMTLDHLRIVNNHLGHIIDNLMQGKIPSGTASTAAVKPDPNVTMGVIEEYENSCDELLEQVAAATNLNTPLCYRHPWFGPMNAHAWHALAASHMAIHRVQIERICAGLTTAT